MAFFIKIIGEIRWNPPQWVSAFKAKVSNTARAASFKISTAYKKNRRASQAILCGVLALVIGSGLFVQWYRHRPQPTYITFHVVAPGVTPLKDKAKPDVLKISFNQSVMTAKDDHKSVLAGIRLLPATSGTWVWQDDRTLVFTLESGKDWACDQNYEVTFAKSLFASHVILDKYAAEFKTPSFAYSLDEARFYENPANPKEKRVVATVKFSHAVDPVDFKSRVFLALGQSKKSFLSFGDSSFGYTVTFDKFNGEAYIQSDLISIPERDSEMKITIKSGVKPLVAGNHVKAARESVVAIPGMYNYFKITDVSVGLVSNDKFELEQVLNVQASTGINEAEIQKSISVFSLPNDIAANGDVPERKNVQWRSASEVTPAILPLLEKVKLTPVPNEHDASSLYSFKLNAPPRTFILVKIAKGLKSAGDYVLSTAFQEVAKVPAYPAEVRVMSNGAILSVAGEKKLSIMARAVPGIRFEIGRVLPTEVNHLISQTGGDFQRPQFNNYTFNEDNISEKFEEIQALEGAASGKSQYTALNLGKYLGDGSKGLFFLKAEGWNQEKKHAVGSADRRFILVSDLGLIVKKDLLGHHDVFVNSIHKGTPAAGARVELIGKNGLVLISQTTDGQGHAVFPSLQDFKQEKEPVAFIVRKDGDFSFIPFASYDRKINYSRFEVGGVEDTESAGRLTGYLFTDRGIYRPGDEFHVGMIVRPQDWKQNLEGIPVEAEVLDARGIAIHKEKIQLNKQGFSELTYRTEETSPTGSYQVQLYIIKDNRRDELLGSVAFKVEEFLPDAMKIQSHFSTELAEGWVDPKGLKGLVSLQNLFGSPAQSRRITGSIYLSPAFTSFRKYSDYVFYDPMKTEKSFSETLPEALSNEKGEAEFELGLEKYEKATYRLRFQTEGFAAEGGRAVVSESGILVSPLKFLVGYRADSNLNYLKKGLKQNVKLIAVSPNLDQTITPALKAEIIQLKSVSVLTKQNDGTFKYESVQKEVVVSEKAVSIPKNGLQYALPTESPGDFALVLRDADKTEIQRIAFNVVGPGNGKNKLQKNAELQVQLSKKDYAANEDVELQITSAYAGSGLITIEKDKVYGFKWFKTDTTNTVQKIRVPKDLEGNGYINVTFARSLASTEIFTNPLSYGVAPFSVSRASRTNSIELTTAEVVKPGEALQIKFSQKKAGKIVVFGVDEGILQVAAYKNPDPLEFFFKKRALQVSTRQLLDLILPEFSIVKSMSAAGGDAEGDSLGKNLNPFKRKRDLPVVFWSGILEASTAGGQYTYQVPEYFNGTIRVIAVSVSEDSVGVAEKKTLVRGDFVISPNVPAFTTPQDEMSIGVSISNNLQGGGRVSAVQLALETSEHFQVVGDEHQILNIAPGHEQTAHFKIKTLNKLGAGKLAFSASSGNHKSKYSTEVSIRPAVAYVTTLKTGVLKSAKEEIKVDRKLHAEFHKHDVSLSVLPLGLAHGLFSYLGEYPYGCTEQLISKAFPFLVLSKISEFGLSEENSQKAFQQTLKTLRSRQSAEGAMGVWSAQSDVSELYTAYAYHYLTEASGRGYAVPEEMMKHLETYAKSYLKKDPQTLSDARISAYFAYILARNSILASDDVLALRKLIDNKFADKWAQDATGIYLAATYSLYKQDVEALRLIKQSKLSDKQESDYSSYYDSLSRNAVLLYVMSKHFPNLVKDLKTEDLVSIVNPISEGFYNTISSSYSILALDAYSTQVGNAKTMQSTVAQLTGGKHWAPVVLPPGLFSKANFSLDAQKLKFENHSDVPVFYQMTQAGFDINTPTQELKKGIEVYRDIRDESGNVVTQAKLGERYEVHVKVRSTSKGYIRNVAVVDLIPAGFEVILERTPDASEDNRPTSGDSTSGEDSPAESPDYPEHDESSEPADDEVSATKKDGEPLNREPASRLSEPTSAASNANAWKPEYVDIREDRVVLYGTVDTTLSEFVYKMRAIIPGTFMVPSVYAESMYDRTIQGHGILSKITIEGK